MTTSKKPVAKKKASKKAASKKAPTTAKAPKTSSQAETRKANKDKLRALAIKARCKIFHNFLSSSPASKYVVISADGTEEYFPDARAAELVILEKLAGI